MNKTIAKAAKKADVTVEDAIKIIAYDHYLDKMIPKKKLKSVDLDLPLDTLSLLKKIASSLKVSLDAVVGHALSEALAGRRRVTK
jgi:hypothetical protein